MNTLTNARKDELPSPLPGKTEGSVAALVPGDLQGQCQAMDSLTIGLLFLVWN